MRQVEAPCSITEAKTELASKPLVSCDHNKLLAPTALLGDAKILDNTMEERSALPQVCSSHMLWCRSGLESAAPGIDGSGLGQRAIAKGVEDAVLEGARLQRHAVEPGLERGRQRVLQQAERGRQPAPEASLLLAARHGRHHRHSCSRAAHQHIMSGLRSAAGKSPTSLTWGTLLLVEMLNGLQ